MHVKNTKNIRICTLAHNIYIFVGTHVAAMCSPGSYSDTGLVPCARCAVGTYQSQRNTRTCTQCPHGTVTSIVGTVALQDCQGTLKSHNVVYVNTTLCM